MALPVCACFPTSDEDLSGGGGDDDNHVEGGGCDRNDGGDRDDADSREAQKLCSY